MTHVGNYVARLIPLFYTQDSIVVTVTEPDEGDVVITATPTIEWTFSPGTQQSFIVQIFSDEDADNLVYSSGFINSSDLFHTLSAGQLENFTSYWVTVAIFTTDGISGQSELVEFSTSFAPASDVTGVTLQVFDLCVDPRDVPYIDLHWTEIVPAGLEVFVEYRVQRREGGESTWVNIASIDDITTLRFKDYLPRSYAVYEYAVVWVATSGASTLISVAQDPPVHGQARFDYGWLQPAADPGAAALQINALSVNIDTHQEMTLALTAGRQRPTAFVGEPLYHTVAVPPVEKAVDDQHWTEFLDFVEAQAEGTMYCLRLGKQRLRYFGVIQNPRRPTAQKSYSVAFTFAEAHYQEDVTV